MSYVKHMRTNTPEYRSWISMKGRCCNPKNPSFHYYGGRGIKVNQEWISSFERFFQDMGPRPSPDYWIERINNNGNYEPANCRWATPAEQGNNRRNNIFITFQGKTQSVSQWSREVPFRISINSLQHRIENGWTPERALTTVPTPTGRHRSPLCRSGKHALSEENVRIDSRGLRHCRTCERAYWRLWQRAKKQIELEGVGVVKDELRRLQAREMELEGRSKCLNLSS